MKKLLLCVLFSCCLMGCSTTPPKKVAIEDIILKSENIDRSKLSEDDIRAVSKLEENGLSVVYLKESDGSYKASVRDDSMMIYLNGYRGIQNDVYIMHFKTYLDFDSIFIAQELEEGFEYIYLKNNENNTFGGYPLDTSRQSEEDAKATKALTDPHLDEYNTLKTKFKSFREKIGIVDFNELADFVERLSTAYVENKEGNESGETPKTDEEQIQSRCNAENSGSYIMLENGELATCP